MGEREPKFGDRGLAYTALLNRIESFERELYILEDDIQMQGGLERILIERSREVRANYEKSNSLNRKKQLMQEAKDIRDTLTNALKVAQPMRDKHEELKRKILDLEKRLAQAVERIEIPEA